MSNAYMLTQPKYVAHVTSIPLQEKMELRVVEYTKGDRIAKVELQYRMHSYTESGVPSFCTDWHPVERVKIEME